MQKSEGLAKAAAMMTVLAALATMLAVHVDPPAKPKSRHTRGREARLGGIPALPTTPWGGVGAAQERGTAVERREAGDDRAPKQSSGSEP